VQRSCFRFACGKSLRATSGRSFIGAVDPKRTSIFQAEADQSPVAAMGNGRALRPYLITSWEYWPTGLLAPD
jgi:hypothetical protein